jgi:predicted Mrr-cat superfamily restriction endonuclease
VIEQLRACDNVLVPTGRSTYRVAIVAGPYYYAGGADVPHGLPVDWLSGELRREDMSEGLRLALQFWVAAQNLQKHSPELRELLEQLG